MSNKRSYFFLCVLLVLAACQKNETFSIPPAQVDKIVNNCSCEIGAIEYVRGLFNNTFICFSTNANSADTFYNAYYVDTTIHLNHINIMRENKDHTMSCQLSFANTDLYHLTLPYTIPNSGLAYNEYTQIILSDLDQLWTTNTIGDYIGDTYHGFSITITDTTAGFITGTFKGEANTKSGTKVKIENGEFNIKLIDMNKNN